MSYTIYTTPYYFGGKMIQPTIEKYEMDVFYKVGTNTASTLATVIGCYDFEMGRNPVNLTRWVSGGAAAPDPAATSSVSPVNTSGSLAAGLIALFHMNGSVTNATTTSITASVLGS
jgi:hypothetical protein